MDGVSGKILLAWMICGVITPILGNLQIVLYRILNESCTLGPATHCWLNSLGRIMLLLHNRGGE